MAQQRQVLGTSPAAEAGTPDGNRILLGLAAQERMRLRAALQPVTVALGDVIYEQGRRIETCISDHGGDVVAVHHGRGRDRGDEPRRQ